MRSIQYKEKKTHIKKYHIQHQCAKELAHLEMLASIVRQLTKGLSAEELEAEGFVDYYVDHTGGIWPAAAGIPFNACEFQSKGGSVKQIGKLAVNWNTQNTIFYIESFGCYGIIFIYRT